MIPRKLFSEEHESFRASFRKFLEKEVIPHHEAWEERGYVDREVWQKAGEQRFPVPEHARAIRRLRGRSPVQHGDDGRDGQGPHYGPGLFAALRDRRALPAEIRH